MTVAILATLVGLAVLAWSADRFVGGASAVASHLGMPPLLVGMIVIGFGTSAPELVVSAFAATGGNPELALGNAIGSNIANIGLILGVTAIVLPVVVRRGVRVKEIPLTLAATVLLGAVMLDGEITRVDAGILLVALVAQLAWAIRQGRRRDDPLAEDVEIEEARQHLSRRAAWVWTLVGMLLLVVSSRVLVWGAVGIAESLGWSDLVIGLTVVAVGTSAPELAAAVASARRGSSEMVMGNVIGSNLFNVLGVVGLAGIIAPMAVEPAALHRDLPVLIVLTLAVVAMAWRPRARGRINRVEGALLVLAWIAYTVVLLVSAA